MNILNFDPSRNRLRIPAVIALGVVAAGALNACAKGTEAPELVAETTVLVPQADPTAGRTPAKSVELAVCKPIPELLVEANLAPTPEEADRLDGQLIENDCTGVAKDLMDEFDGAQNIVGKQINVRLEDYKDNDRLTVSAQVVG